MSDSDVVIRVEGLGKKYSLHHQQGERYTALRDVVARQAKAAGRLLNPFTLAGQLRKAQREAAQERAESEEEFWALKDVSFEIRRGERVGIIGRNGAGKSTLLKILSRITEPTTGRVEIRGRVASLLEVGTGFHPELTGRENIYLNGAILGMTRREIRLKFDEIVDFAEVEKFLDTPVKRYSSGMYVRLAFAVAAHLETEILVVDEVLAVGDSAFQRKCLGKMDEMSKDGERSLLFVSHQLGAVARICNRGLVIGSGMKMYDGTAQLAISNYLDGQATESSAVYEDESIHSYAWVKRVEVKTSEQAGIHECGQTLSLAAEISTKKAIPGASFSFQVIDSQDNVIIYDLALQEETSFGTHGGTWNLECVFPCITLFPGKYFINLHLAEKPGGKKIQTIIRACAFEVITSAPPRTYFWRPNDAKYIPQSNWIVNSDHISRHWSYRVKQQS
jgi:lipopolysaccharide transport system ATP-binding protein